MTKEQIKTEYATHRTAGLDFVDDYRAQLALDVNSSVMPEEFAIERQNALKVPFGFIKEGDWKNAKTHLTNMLGSLYCDKAEIDNILTSVNDYITNNYSF